MHGHVGQRKHLGDFSSRNPKPVEPLDNLGFLWRDIVRVTGDGSASASLGGAQSLMDCLISYACEPCSVPSSRQR
jgi:hypothetical protein